MSDIQKRHGANLPHWVVDQATYAVTFRLVDSLPAKTLNVWKQELGNLNRKSHNRPREMTPAEEKRIQFLLSERTQRYLDSGAGACWLRQPAVGSEVAKAIQFFDRQRYNLYAWCVMPNHVHAVVQPLHDNSLSQILHSWKSFTAGAIRKILGIRGSIWQRESYDHWIRDAAEFEHAVAYAVHNPCAAGLENWPWVGERRSAVNPGVSANPPRSPEGA